MYTLFQNGGNTKVSFYIYVNKPSLPRLYLQNSKKIFKTTFHDCTFDILFLCLQVKTRLNWLIRSLTNIARQLSVSDLLLCKCLEAKRCGRHGCFKRRASGNLVHACQIDLLCLKPLIASEKRLNNSEPTDNLHAKSICA